MSVLEECYKSGCLTALDIVEVNLDLVAEEFRKKQVQPLTQIFLLTFFCKSDQKSPLIGENIVFFSRKGFGSTEIH